MKKYLIVFVVFFTLSVTQSCKNSGAKTEATETVAEGDEHTSKYVCPMHCTGSGSTEAGECPVCGMDYVLNENFEGEHNH